MPNMVPSSPQSVSSVEPDDQSQTSINDTDDRSVESMRSRDDEREPAVSLVDDDDENEDDDENDDDVSSIGSKNSVDKHDSGDDNDEEEDDQPDISKRLTDMLGDDSDDEESVKVDKKKRKHRRPDKYSKQRDRSGHSISNDVPPSFAELEAKGAYVPRKELRDINTVYEPEKNTDDMKRELLFKFELLRKSYPTSTIPEYSVHTDYTMMLNSYEDCVRRLSLDSSVENYKQYLIYGFMGLEFILGKFLKLDMEGFTQQQIISMSSYEKLLIELGEKSYVPEGSGWSVEVRLLGLVLMNTAFFVVSKMIMAKTSVNLMNMMNGMSPKVEKAKEEAAASKRKMKGPELDLDDLP